MAAMLRYKNAIFYVIVT